MATPETILRVLITARDRRTLDELIHKHELDTSCGGPKLRKDGTATIEALVASDQVERLERAGVTIDVLADATAEGRARQQEVGKGNRFTGEHRVPRGLGRKVKAGGHGVS